MLARSLSAWIRARSCFAAATAGAECWPVGNLDAAGERAVHAGHDLDWIAVGDDEVGAVAHPGCTRAEREAGEPGTPPRPNALCNRKSGAGSAPN